MEKTPFDKLLNLAGKTVIVTGGAGGIGFGISYRLAEAGANVVIAGRTLSDAEKGVQELSARGWRARAIKADVSQEQDVINLIAQTTQAFGSLDILVNNAGIFPSIPMINLTLTDFERILATNLRGVFLCTKYASSQMIRQGKGGKIINITSIDALHPSMVGLSAYDASKHGVWGFTKNVALELAPHKIWVNAVAPGGVLTPGVQKSMPTVPGTDQSKVSEAFAANIPMHRMGDIDDIGKVVLFLASDMSSYMTGSQIVVDGGYLLS